MAGSVPQAPFPPRLRLRLLETADLHMHILPHDYCTDRPCDTVGLARVATLIAQARAEAHNTLLFDNGDFLQGNPMADYFALERPGAPHPMIAAMNVVGYDAGTLGNHDFNFGLHFLDQALQEAAFPFVSANAVTERAVDPSGDRTLVPPWALLHRRMTDTEGRAHDLRIGVIGFVPPQITQWDRVHLEGRLDARGVAEAARAHVPALRAAGADLVIALAHTGIATTRTGDDPGECGAQALAQVPGIDVLLCGHSHLCFPAPDFPPAPGVDPARGTVHGKPALMPGLWGSHLGVMDLDLVREADGWRLADFSASLRPIFARDDTGAVRPLVASCPQVEAVAAPAHAEVLAHLRRPVGQISGPIQSFLALVAPDAGLTLVARAQADHVATRLRGQTESALPLLSAVAPFKCGGRTGPGFFIDIPQGPLLRSHVAELCLYPNAVTAVEVSGAQLAEWLERSAAVFNRLVPGQEDQPLINPAVPSYDFDVIAGLRYEIDASAPARYDACGALIDPAARRIRALSHEGRPVAPDDRFIVATNSFRTSGAGHFVGARGRPVPLGPPTNTVEALLALLRQTPEVEPRAEPIWRLAAVAGASAVFDTAPQALRDTARLAALGLEPLGLQPSGFARLRLRLG